MTKSGASSTTGRPQTFTLQEEIAKEITTTLRRRLTIEDEKRTQEGRSSSSIRPRWRHHERCRSFSRNGRPGQRKEDRRAAGLPQSQCGSDTAMRPAVAERRSRRLILTGLYLPSRRPELIRAAQTVLVRS